MYGAILHYLAAIKATGGDDGPTVVKQMKTTPVNDFMTTNGKIREDGTLVRDMYLFEVKKPSIEGSMGLLQADRSDPRRGSCPAPTNVRWSRADNESLAAGSPARICDTAPHWNNQPRPVFSVRCRSRPSPWE